jgi:hypothetical protein
MCRHVNRTRHMWGGHMWQVHDNASADWSTVFCMEDQVDPTEVERNPTRTLSIMPLTAVPRGRLVYNLHWDLDPGAPSNRASSHLQRYPRVHQDFL